MSAINQDQWQLCIKVRILVFDSTSCTNKHYCVEGLHTERRVLNHTKPIWYLCFLVSPKTLRKSSSLCSWMFRTEHMSTEYLIIVYSLTHVPSEYKQLIIAVMLYSTPSNNNYLASEGHYNSTLNLTINIFRT